MPARARSLAEDLRSRTDEQLARALVLRPDVSRPIPRSFADLALRLNTAASVIEALDELTASHLHVLEGACALAPAGRFGVAELAAGLDAQPDVVAPLVTDLYERVLLWGGSDDLRVPSAVREVMGPYPCGLDSVVRENLPGIRSVLADPTAFADRLALAPAAARELLFEHTWGPPVLAEAPGRDWLAGADFMAVDELGNVILPREIALHLRRGLLIREATLEPPALPLPDSAVAPHAAHAADQFVRDTDRVLQRLARTGLPRQANGAFPSREFDRLAADTALTEANVGLIISVTSAAGWVGTDSEGRLRPTTDYEIGLAHPIAERWATLASAWLTMQRSVPKDPARVFAVNRDPASPRHRRMTLAAQSAGAREDPNRWLSWYRPRLRIPAAQIGAIAAEAELLGLTFGGIPGPAGLAAAGETCRVADLSAAVAPGLPALTDRVVLQADLTATSLGPLEPTVERRLSEVATWESGGGATVFRFTPDSVRGALSRGVVGSDFLAWLRQHSATEVPQALEVLLADQEQALPATYVHAVSCVITCPADVAARLVTDDELAHLQLRELAPGVIVSSHAGTVVAAALLDRGISVAASGDATGPVVADGITVRATTPPDPGRVVRSLRKVESGTAHPTPEPPPVIPTPPAQVHAALASAADTHTRLWLTFASEDGDRITHLLEPLDLRDGDVCAFDHTAREIRTIPLERIVSAAPYA